MKSEPQTLAQQADPYQLYELAVQSPEAEISFIRSTFQTLRGREPKLLREDFCGTAAICCAWVQQGMGYRAIGIDQDAAVLQWAKQHHLTEFTPADCQRLQLLQSDVLTARTEQTDVIIAMNFSYWVFKTRQRLKEYFQRVYRQLKTDGIFFLDAYGGYDAFRELIEERQVEHFVYLWEQAAYNPISGEMQAHIHFRFADGSDLQKAFRYDWRLWTLPELQELLIESGFRKVRVYWQGFDQDDEPTGLFEPTQQGTADAGWICYLTAEK